MDKKPRVVFESIVCDDGWDIIGSRACADFLRTLKQSMPMDVGKLEEKRTTRGRYEDSFGTIGGGVVTVSIDFSETEVEKFLKGIVDEKS